FYERHGVPVRFVGHPLVEQLPADPDVPAARVSLGLPAQPHPVVALLPGSRHKEIVRHLPSMLAGVASLKASFPDLRAVLPVASTIPRELIEDLVRRSGLEVTVVEGHATEALTAADVAVVCSGTATLQAALLKRPMVVVYRVSWLTYQILKRLIKVAHIALVNLIAGDGLVPELVQSAFTPANVAHEVGHLLSDAPHRAQLIERFAALRTQLGSGNTAHAVAQVVLGYLSPEEHAHA
ncbi:MAG TPA: lipid-A-disaccharide synthase, partial [Myxococcota bacterium]|nr:lipid-A-disaccharide synthase [Myxococcota bacterium]